MKKTKSLLLGLVMCLSLIPLNVYAVSDANNGDWSAKTATLKNTGEAELMVRVGDIDALNDADAIVLKAAYIQGWTLSTDGNYTLNFTEPVKFADDDKISDWAKPSVYFMTANEIIAGTGNNIFSPRATTAAEQAAFYASATREQALAIAIRIVDNLKGKPLELVTSG